jgi:electron transport complex protein RnfE
MRKHWQQFRVGLVAANPLFVLALGLCPALAVSTLIDNGIAMSGAVFFVLLPSAIVISSIKKLVPNIVRIPIFIVVIATFVTCIVLIFEAFFPALHEALGIFLPLVVVNCIILGRAEAFASKNSVTLSIADAVGASVGFGLAMVIIAFFREILWTGGLKFFGFHLFTLPVIGEYPLTIFVLPPGAFLIIGLILGLARWRGWIRA